MEIKTKKKWISDKTSMKLSIWTIIFSSLGFMLEGLLLILLNNDLRIPFNLLNFQPTWDFLAFLYLWWLIGLVFCSVFCIVGLIGALFEKEKESFFFYGGLIACFGVIFALCIVVTLNSIF